MLITFSLKDLLDCYNIVTKNLPTKKMEPYSTLKTGPNVPLTYHYCLVYYEGDSI